MAGQETDQQAGTGVAGPWGSEGVPEPVYRLVMDWLARSTDDFLASTAARRDLEERERLVAVEAIRTFGTLMLVESGETPAEWTRRGLQWLLDEVLPHEYPHAGGADYPRLFVRVVHRWLDWLGERHRMPRALELAEVLAPYRADGYPVCDCATNREVFEVGARVMADADLDAGSLTDTALYIAKYTQAIMGETPEDPAGDPAAVFRPVPAGELPLCPCGSGRVADACCGGGVN